MKLPDVEGSELIGEEVRSATGSGSHLLHLSGKGCLDEGICEIDGIRGSVVEER